MYVRFACLYIYEYVYSYHCEMGTCMSGLRVSISMSMCTGVTARWTRVCAVCVSLYEHVYCCHCEMGTCMYGLHVSLFMSMCAVVKARWTRVCTVCMSLYL